MISFAVIILATIDSKEIRSYKVIPSSRCPAFQSHEEPVYALHDSLATLPMHDTSGRLFPPLNERESLDLLFTRYLVFPLDAVKFAESVSLFHAAMEVSILLECLTSSSFLIAGAMKTRMITCSHFSTWTIGGQPRMVSPRHVTDLVDALGVAPEVRVQKLVMLHLRQVDVIGIEAKVCDRQSVERWRTRTQNPRFSCGRYLGQWDGSS